MQCFEKLHITKSRQGGRTLNGVGVKGNIKTKILILVPKHSAMTKYILFSLQLEKVNK